MTDNNSNSDSEDLMNEILYGKKTKVQTNGLSTAPNEDFGDFPDKDLGNSKDEHDAVDEILFGKSKPKSEPAEKTEKPAGKKFDREEYFGL